MGEIYGGFCRWCARRTSAIHIHDVNDDYWACGIPCLDKARELMKKKICEGCNNKTAFPFYIGQKKRWACGPVCQGIIMGKEDQKERTGTCDTCGKHVKHADMISWIDKNSNKHWVCSKGCRDSKTTASKSKPTALQYCRWCGIQTDTLIEYNGDWLCCANHIANDYVEFKGEWVGTESCAAKAKAEMRQMSKKQDDKCEICGNNAKMWFSIDTEDYKSHAACSKHCVNKIKTQIDKKPKKPKSPRKSEKFHELVSDIGATYRHLDWVRKKRELYDVSKEIEALDDLGFSAFKAMKMLAPNVIKDTPLRVIHCDNCLEEIALDELECMWCGHDNTPRRMLGVL